MCYNLLFHGVLNLDVDDDHWWNAGGIFFQNYDYFVDEDEDNRCLKKFFIYLHYIKIIFVLVTVLLSIINGFFVVTWAFEVLAYYNH